MSQKRSIGVVLFDQFELLDVFGPLEMLGLLPGDFEICLIIEKGGEEASGQGPSRYPAYELGRDREAFGPRYRSPGRYRGGV